MPRKHCDGVLTRAQDRALRSLLRYVEERRGPVDSGRLFDGMRQFAHGETPGAAPEAVVAFRVWEQFSDRATCRAWIEAHRANPSALSARRREQMARKAAALEQVGFERGRIEGSDQIAIEARRVVGRVFRKEQGRRHRAADGLEDRASIFRSLAAFAVVAALCVGVVVLLMGWMSASPDFAWTYVFDLPAAVFLAAFIVLKVGIEGVAAGLMGAGAFSGWRARRLREESEEYRRLAQNLRSAIRGASHPFR